MSEHGTLRWVLLQDRESAPYIVAGAPDGGLYLIAPVWKENEVYPMYGLNFVPGDAPLDHDAMVHADSLIHLEGSNHYLTAHRGLFDIAEKHCADPEGFALNGYTVADRIKYLEAELDRLDEEEGFEDWNAVCEDLEILRTRPSNARWQIAEDLT
jgi:hypothetical protein